MSDEVETAGTVGTGGVGGAGQERRTRELSSLYATARSLTALGDLDDVLHSIVRHAHDLIGTDFTYLSLVGADGGLSITASEGTISSAFRAARIPPGTGLGGKVLATRAAHFVNKYADSDLDHHPGFDALVDDEGLIALLGVPLLVRDEAIGVLFAAERAERNFRADEIALLTAFADHAAVAMDNARLYAESRASVDRLSDANRTIEEQVAVMERAQAVHEALTGVVLTGGGPESIAQRLVAELGGSVVVLGREGESLAGAGAAPDQLAVECTRDPGLVSARAEATSRGRCVSIGDGGEGSRNVVPVQAGDAVLGAIVCSQPRPLDAVDARTLELAAHVVALLVLKENAAADAEERLSGELLAELMVAGPVPSATQRTRARARGIDLDELCVMVVVEAGEARPGEVVRRLHVLARERGGLAVEHLGRPTLLLPDGARDAPSRDVARYGLPEELHARLRRELGTELVLLADRVPGQDWGRAHGRAVRCLAVARALGHTDAGLATQGLALYALVFDPERGDDLGLFVEETIGALVDYDRRRATDLVGTMDAYFQHGGNLSRTARALHVHLNTLLKRLDRTVAILGQDWRAADDLALRVAVRLHLLNEAAGATRP